MVVVEDELLIRAPLERVFRCFWEPGLWTRITPHVKRIEMLEERASRQRFLMTIESEGRAHTVETSREAIPNESITYRQSKPPAFPNDASGAWGPEEADQLLARDGRAWRRP